MKIFRLLALFASMAINAAFAQQDVKIIQDYETDSDLKVWVTAHDNEYFKEKPAFRPSYSDQHVTSGKRSLKIAPTEYLSSFNFLKDWSGYDALEIDIFVEGDDPVGGSILITDDEYVKKPNYWNRHNGTFNLKPGANSFSLPVNGLYRGEAGSRGADLKTNINPKSIMRFDIGFKSKGKVQAIYLDNVRLVKESRPAGIMAFDFGPESQTVFPGFTPISGKTVFGQNGCEAGLHHPIPSPSFARDDTFPTRLYQDFVEMGDNLFIANVPNGKYHVWVMFDDIGYWGGEQARFKRRSISASEKEVWSEDRGEAGPGRYLFAFENIEPKPSDDLWDLYLSKMFVPAKFDVNVADGRLQLKFTSDLMWGCKVAGMIVYPDSIKADGEKWVAEVEARNRKDFEARAAFMGPKPKELDVPPAAADKGYWLGYPRIEEDVTFVDAPGKSEGSLSKVGARGQLVANTFAVRALKDFPEVKLTASDLKGPAGTIPASAVDLRYQHHLTHRGFNDIAYTIKPIDLRHLDGSGLTLSKDLTRQFWVNVQIPADAKPGVYTGEVILSAGTLNEKLPLSIEVLDVALDEPNFPFGFLGMWAPGELPEEFKKTALNDLFKTLKSYGLSSFSGGPEIELQGFDESGKPKLNFKRCDEYFKAYKDAGFTLPVYHYGGPGYVNGLHDGYTIGNTGRGWEKKLGKPFTEILKTVWATVDEHAKQAGWPKIYYGMLDEPRVLESAKENLEFHKAYHDAMPDFPMGGFYSVNWKSTDPCQIAIQDIFKTMQWSGLNEWHQTDLDTGKQLGREVHIYNNGLSRFTFGVYQFAAMRKGIKGRMEWHQLALHGYQFFDLDGREPDFSAIQWGHKEIYPTLNLVRAAEGAADFRFATTLFNKATEKKDTPEGKAALEYLEQFNTAIAPGKREEYKGYPGDDAFRAGCIEHLRKLLK